MKRPKHLYIYDDVTHKILPPTSEMMDSVFWIDEFIGNYTYIVAAPEAITFEQP